jgi:hypothetical protein
MLDFGTGALVDTFDHLRTAGVSSVGAGPDEQAARAPVVLQRSGFEVGIMMSRCYCPGGDRAS